MSKRKERIVTEKMDAHIRRDRSATGAVVVSRALYMATAAWQGPGIGKLAGRNGDEEAIDKKATMKVAFHDPSAVFPDWWTSASDHHSGFLRDRNH
jgi:hypothetical protein